MTENPALLRLLNPEASFYWSRLIVSTQLKSAIDEGAYGDMNWYSASSITLQQEAANCAVNIRPDRHHPKGLINGVQIAIFGSYRWLVANGYEEEVKQLMEHASGRDT